MKVSRALPGPAMALMSAALFGFSTPLAKLLLGGGISPGLLAGLLYLGSGLGLALIYLGRGLIGVAPAEAPLRRADMPWLALVVLAGGVAGPLLLMVGLRGMAASSAALLLNVEGVATMAIAWIVFRENVDRRLLIGAASILAGAVALSWRGPASDLGLGAMAVIGACLCWAIDNNLTRKLSSADPVQIAAIKGMVAGAANLAIALAGGAGVPRPGFIVAGLVTGFFGYGISLVLFVLALRALGAARTGAYFSTAPFLGAALSLALFREPLTLQLFAAAALMSLGVYLHLTEQHEHSHHHEPLEHEHSHVHDQHHTHSHEPDAPPSEPHAHWHRHAPVRHKHQHYPDLHHRHSH